jgi:predicted signal transduction protein with EAL and GGDEF domain
VFITKYYKLYYSELSMSTTITIRIPRELKEKMKQNPAQWSEEVRHFIEEKIRNLELQRTLEEVEPRAQKRRVRTDSTTLIREDRQRQT